MIYLASAYTHADESVMQRRYEHACKACALAVSAGLIIYSPIAHWHPIAKQYGLRRDFEFWEESNKLFITLAKSFWILDSNGLEYSSGVKSDLRTWLNRNDEAYLISVENDELAIISAIHEIGKI